jgi:hypothetical protein
MVSLSKIGNSEGAVKYYASYALEQGEIRGEWVGRACGEILIDNKEVTEENLRHLLSGCDTKGTSLLKLQGRHTPGWDLTFSAPKSVSIVWSSSAPELRKNIENAQRQAVCDAFDYLEDHSAKSRVGKEAFNMRLIASLFSIPRIEIRSRTGNPFDYFNVSLSQDRRWKRSWRSRVPTSGIGRDEHWPLQTYTFGVSMHSGNYL